MAGKKKQGYSARLDERLGMTRGRQATKKMSASGRRKVSKGVRKAAGGKPFGFIGTTPTVRKPKPSVTRKR